MQSDSYGKRMRSFFTALTFMVVVSVLALASIGAAYAQTNESPKIYGTPATTAYVGEVYYFLPIVVDPDGPKQKFVIKNRPSWASFSYQSGSIRGRPTAPGWNNGIVIYVQDTRNPSVPLKAFSIQVLDNKAPVISGNPVTQTQAGQAYSFQPQASDADGNTLAFAIANKPSWAQFDTSTGKLSGTPAAANVGAYSNIAITVSDGRIVTPLPLFTIVVTTAPISIATLTWTPPTQNTDGSSLTDLAGYRVLYGVSKTALGQVIDIPNPSLSLYVVENLTPGTWYFCIKAFNSKGGESVCSGVASKTIS